MVDLAQTASPFEVIYTVGALLAVGAFVVLLLFAFRDSAAVLPLPVTHPDRMIAGDAIVNEVIRFMLAVGILAIGLAALVTPPARESSAFEPSILSVTLFLVLITWEVILLLWGLKDLWFRRRLFTQIAGVRQVCAESTYANCPFTKPGFTPESIVEPPSTSPNGGHSEA